MDILFNPVSEILLMSVAPKRWRHHFDLWFRTTYNKTERELFAFLLHHFLPRFSSLLRACLHFFPLFPPSPSSLLLLLLSPRGAFLYPRGAGCTLKHCGSLSFKTHSLKIAPFSHRVRGGVLVVVFYFILFFWTPRGDSQLDMMLQFGFGETVVWADGSAFDALLMWCDFFVTDY